MGVIQEDKIYGQVFLEVSTNGSSWTDVTADLITANGTRGQAEQREGLVSTEVGTLTFSLADTAHTFALGDFVRFRTTAGQYFWTGSISNVSKAYEFTPQEHVITTVTAVDWVAVAAGTQVNGAGVDVYAFASSWDTTINFLNSKLEPSADTRSLLATVLDDTKVIGFTDLVASAAEHLDVVCNSITAGRWFANKIPATDTLPPAGCLQLNYGAHASTGLTFTDVAGSGLHYTDVIVQQDSGAVVNYVELTNRCMIDLDANGRRIYADHVAVSADTASIAANGQNSAGVSNIVATPSRTHPIFPDVNYVENPALRDSADMWQTGTFATFIATRRQTMAQATPFAAYVGSHALMNKITVATASTTIQYLGIDNEGIPCGAGQTFRFECASLRYGSLTDTRSRAELLFFDEDGTVLQTSSGNYTTLTTARAWYNNWVRGTAPAGTAYVRPRIFFNRSGAGNFTVGHKVFGDAFSMYEIASTSDNNTMPWFDGDTADTIADIYVWRGERNASPSMRLENTVQTRADAIVAANNSNALQVRGLRWNSQEDMTKLALLDLDKTISVVFNGVTETYVITGLSFSVDYARLMVDISVQKA